MIVHGDWLLTPARAAVHRPTATAVLADLHLGYEKARHRSGEAVPARSIDDILSILIPFIFDRQVKHLVIAGDLFERGADSEIAEELQTWLKAARIELTAVVPGNHDGSLSALRDRLPVYPEGFKVGGWHIVHGDGPLPDGPVVQGHEHPWVRWSDVLSGPCYLVGTSRIILPAFSTDAAGVNVLPGRRWADHRCCVIAGDKVLDFGELGPLRRRMRRQ